MDAFNLKKDNRKKFQDKQKLKRRHATQSDLKYRKLNKEEEVKKKEGEEAEAEEEVPLPLPSNEDRYTDDVLYIPPDHDTQLQIESLEANKIIRKKLNESNTLEDSIQSLQIKDPLTSMRGKDMMTLDINSLNKMIGRESSDQNVMSNKKEPAHPVIAAVSTKPTSINDTRNTKQDTQVKTNNVPGVSMVPTDLKDDEDFLDGLL